MRVSRRRGFTLLEVIVAYSILALLTVLVIGAILSATRPINDTSIRAQVFTEGTSVLGSVVRDLSGGYNVEVGTLQTSPSLALIADTTDDDPGPDEVFTGRAVRYQVAVDWDVALEQPILSPPEPLTTNPHIFAFELDTSGTPPFPGALQLVHYLPGGQKVVLQKAIQADGITVDPPDTPSFSLKTPSELEMAFTIRRQVDFDTASSTPIYARVEFREVVNLRNLNQY